MAHIVLAVRQGKFFHLCGLVKDYSDRTSLTQQIRDWLNPEDADCPGCADRFRNEYNI